MDRPLLGFVGLGTMGRPMVRNLMRAGFSVVVYNRSPKPAEELAAEGATAVALPSDVGRAADVVISCVSDSPDVELVVLGENGVLSEGFRCRTVIDMSTISPTVARNIGVEAKNRGAGFLDAPVSGGEPGAIAGTLSIMVGGDRGVFDDCRPIFEAMGKNVVYMGESGSGQATKLCNQVVIVLNILAVSEGVALGQKFGLDPDALISAIGGGAAGSWALSNLAPKMVEEDWRPGFKISLQQKDLRIALSAAEEMMLPLPGTALTHQLFRSAQALGHNEDGTQALIAAIRALAGVHPHPNPLPSRERGPEAPSPPKVGEGRGEGHV